jgi:hypothetical protein
MYGWNNNIPGFSFYDKKEDEVLVMGLAKSVDRIEKEVQENAGEGILKGGSSISNLLCGQAERSILTVRHLFEHKGEKKKVRDIVKIVLLNPTSIAKVFVSSIYEFLLEIYEGLVIAIPKRIRGEPVNWPFYRPYFPFFRMGVNSILREIATEAALVEVQREVPYIYLTYGGYDWVSHYRGPNAPSSYGALDQIDFSVRKVVKEASQKGYDVYIMSDHGQVDSIPFEKKYFEEFEDFIERATKLKAKEIDMEEEERGSRQRYLYYKLKYYTKHVSVPLKALLWVFTKILKKSLPKAVIPKVSTKKQEIVISISSCLAHLYFTKEKKRLSISQIEALYPFLIERIVQHDGVGFIIGIDKGKTIVLAKDGKYEISKDGYKSFGNRFLPIYGEEEKLIDQIREFSSLKYFGDLALNGSYDGKKFVTFEHFHFGTHDGIGGNQQIGFFASKNKMDLDKVKNAKELYKFFKEYHK